MPPTHTILSLVGPEQVNRVRAAAPKGVVVRTIAFKDLRACSGDLVGGAVVIDPADWHAESAMAAATFASAAGARLVIFSRPSERVCGQIAAVAKIATSEVVLTDTDDSIPHLRSVIARSTSSVPALVLQALSPRIALLGEPLGPMVTASFAWAAIPREVGDLCELTGLSRKRILAGLDHQGLGTTRVDLEAARVARAFHYLTDGTALTAVSDDAGFGSEGAMRGAFRRTLAVPPHAAALTLSSAEAAARLVDRARRGTR